MQIPSPLPLAATIDLQYRLPPPQPIHFTPTIVISLVLLALALIAVTVLAYRGRARAKKAARNEALKLAEKVLAKRGGTGEDIDRLLYIFNTHPMLDPASVVMLKDKFHDQLRPLMEATFDRAYADRIEKLFFPPPKDTRRGISVGSSRIKAMVEEQKTVSTSQTAAAILDLMDATLKPGVITRLGFDGLEGGYECLVMGHDMQSINVTLPAHNDHLVSSIRPGMRIEGTLESGPSLMAFTSSVIQAVAGSMPYCRITPWKSAWEIRKRDSVRLPVSLDVDFQHISTSATESIKMSNLDKEIGTIRPGKLMDLSLGGCCLETPSSGVFRVGDMVRFSKSLVTGNPPATLLGAIVNADMIDPELNDGSVQRLHIQFLVIDDVSQRILVRTMRQLQDVMDRDEWMQAQQLLQKMRRNKVQTIGSPGPVGRRAGESAASHGQSSVTRTAPGGGARSGGTTRPGAAKRSSTTRPGVKPPTRGYPNVGGQNPGKSSQGRSGMQ